MIQTRVFLEAVEGRLELDNAAPVESIYVSARIYGHQLNIPTGS